MKLVVGMGAIDDYVSFVKAGADEIFVGYVPMSWQIEEGSQNALNRREVSYYNVQIGSESELEILKDLVKEYGVPVTIAFNSLQYEKSQYAKIAQIMKQCVEFGFSSFILADYNFLQYINQLGFTKDLDFHVSGEYGECNHYLLEEFCRLGANRVIFHRKVSLDNMKSMTQYMAEHKAELEYEAFFLNEMCHFHGGYCNSLHCDELPPMCRMPYRMKNMQGNTACCENQEEGEEKNIHADVNAYIAGYSGCGLCALWKLQEADIKFLKIVGRGLFAEDMIKDIAAAKRALEILEDSRTEEEYLHNMKKAIFPQGCGGNCYYR